VQAIAWKAQLRLTRRYWQLAARKPKPQVIVAVARELLGFIWAIGIQAERRQVFVEGRLRTLEFETKNNGGKRQRTEIVALRVQFLGSHTAEKSEASAIEEPMAPPEDVPF
jgi:hypothetical protein